MSGFSELVKELDAYLPKEQIDEVYEAFVFSSCAHEKQKRSSGEPYITHPVAVATILASMQLDKDSVMAALLHDVIEDTETEKKVLEKHFGKDVAKLVDGVTKLTQIQFESREKAQAENFRKMIMAMVDDIRVILIKLADRLHNMSTLGFLPYEKKARIARETLEIYAPIANRLGMNAFRTKFEDLGFEALHPLRYRILKKSVEKARGNRKAIIQEIEAALAEGLAQNGLDKVRVWGRQKHLYSIYKKMKQKRLPFNEIMDVYAFRIIVDSVDACYRALGMVHGLYKPFHERFKDYIAIPKTNGYQSLHTVLFGPYGVPIEVQIRTREMDKMAENGIAAHWLYKTNEHIVNQAQIRARAWIKGLLELQKSAGNSLEFIEHVKIDLFPDEVYVFTPKGDILKLPHGATAVDFAYEVHSDVGDRCVAVKLDRKLTPLSTHLRNGQTIEVITAPNAKPNPDWLNFVVTAKARSHVRHYLKTQRRSDSILLGKRLMQQALAAQHLTLKDLSRSHIKKVLKQFKSKDDLFEQIGLGTQLAPIVVRRLMNPDKLIEPVLLEPIEGEAPPIYIKGTEGVVVSFAKCCRPIPNDPIAGVLTAGHGLVIHHAECKNLVSARKQPDKYIPVSWEPEVEGDFEVELQFVLASRRGMLANIALVVSELDANIINVTFGEQDARFTTLTMVVTVKNRAHLARLIQRLRHLKYVDKVIRRRNV